MRRQFLARYPELSPTRFITLPNGFDPADFDGVSPAERDGRFTIVYTGSLYGERQSARPFLTALRRALDHSLIPRTDIRLRFVGNTGYEASNLVKGWGLDDVVQFTGYLPHAEMIPHQLCADVLLLIIGSGPGSEVVFTGKIFEYMAAGKPVLALVPEGAAADLLTEAQIGHIVSPDQPDAIAETLTGLFTDWRNRRLHGSPDPTVISRFDRRQQTGELARILDKVSS
jgi:glycosyltransferase involved in cell wall biosynthesis